MTETLIQILIVVLIIATLFAIANFWRLFKILAQVEEATKIISKRTKEFDYLAQGIVDMLSGLKQGLSDLFQSLGVLELIRAGIDKIKKKG